MKANTDGLTMNQLAERNAEHVTTIAALESRCASLSAKLNMINDLMEAAERSIAEQSSIVAAAEKLVRCKGRYHSELNYRALAKLFGVITPDLPPLEHENVHYADAAEVEIAALHQRIAELERSETQLINERDNAESALDDMYQAATGECPEWSNMFGFADAVDVVEERLATLEANQSQTTPTGIQLITEAIGAHGYIVGCLLQGRPDLALEESRKWVSAFGQAAEIVSAQDAAGIGVKQQDSVDSDVDSRNQPGMVVAIHIDAGDFVKVKGQVFEVEETDFDDHDVTLWFVGGNALKCAAGCPVEVVSEPVAAGIKVKGE